MNVVITGTSSGLGRELAKVFLAEGDRVIGFSRSAATLPQSEFYQHHMLDISDSLMVTSAAAASQADVVDLVINNAGLPGSGRSIVEVEPGEIQELLNVNLFGSLNVVKSFLPMLKRSNSARVINISSRFGSMSFNRETENRKLKISYSYRISKAAQNMLAVCLANELEESGVSVSVLHPGSFQSACGRADAHRKPDEVAKDIHDWIVSGADSKELRMREVGVREYDW